MNLARVVKALTVSVSNSIPRRGNNAGSGSGSCASPICWTIPVRQCSCFGFHGTQDRFELSSCVHDVGFGAARVREHHLASDQRKGQSMTVMKPHHADLL